MGGSLVTGSSRGSAGDRAALGGRGASVVVTARAYEPSPSTRNGTTAPIPGTIGETLELIRAAGVRRSGWRPISRIRGPATGWSTMWSINWGGSTSGQSNAGYADYALIEDMSLDTFDRTVEHIFGFHSS